MCVCVHAFEVVVGGVFKPFQGPARVHALSATAKDNTHARTHAHTLKMEVRDQSSDGQVGGGVKDICRSGNVNQDRSFAAVCPLCS